MLEWFNTVAAGVLAAISGWAVMSPRVQLGLVMLVGMATVSLGFLALCLLGLQGYAYADGKAAASALVHAGLVLLAIGYWRRARRRGHQRRASDWVERR